MSEKISEACLKFLLQSYPNFEQLVFDIITSFQSILFTNILVSDGTITIVVHCHQTFFSLDIAISRNDGAWKCAFYILLAILQQEIRNYQLMPIFRVSQTHKKILNVWSVVEMLRNINRYKTRFLSLSIFLYRKNVSIKSKFADKNINKRDYRFILTRRKPKTIYSIF